MCKARLCRCTGGALRPALFDVRLPGLWRARWSSSVANASADLSDMARCWDRLAHCGPFLVTTDTARTAADAHERKTEAPLDFPSGKVCAWLLAIQRPLLVKLARCSCYSPGYFARHFDWPTDAFCVSHSTSLAARRALHIVAFILTGKLVLEASISARKPIRRVSARGLQLTVVRCAFSAKARGGSVAETGVGKRGEGQAQHLGRLALRY